MCTGIECWRVGPVESPNVAGLVYIAAFGLAECETLGALSRKPHPPQRWRISSPTHMDTAGSGRRLRQPLRGRRRLDPGTRDVRRAATARRVRLRSGDG